MLVGLQLNCLEEATVSFSKKSHLFQGQTTDYQYLNEDRAGENHTEDQELVTTVADKLKYLVDPIVKHLDVDFQKNRTNQEARADLVVEGDTLVKDVPATCLLGLENHLKRIRAVYQHIPTLEPGVKWSLDDTKDNVYTSPEQISFRTEKVRVHKTVAQATPHHPEQVDMWHEDQPVARIAKTKSSGMMTPIQKSRLLGRIDLLIQGVKKARQRANSTEVVTGKLGDVLMSYINGSEV